MTRALTIVAAIAAVAGARRADAEVYRLANGLTVVLAPDPTAGAVVVHVRYAGGSDDGPAHVIEHALTAGSPHVDRGTFAHTLDALGGWDNATTAPDHTSVFEQLPASALPYALFVEADRMAGTVIPASDDHADRADVATMIHRAVWERAASAIDGPALWRSRFQPRDAVLVVAGAFDAVRARGWIEHDFGWIASPPATPAATAKPAPLGRSTMASVDVPTMVPRVIVATRTDAAMSPAALDVEMAVRIVAGGRGSRLHRKLVTADHVATDVAVTARPGRDGGEIAITVDTRDPADTPAIARTIAAELAALADKGITAAELARAKTRAIAELVTALEDLTFRADILASWAAYGVVDLADARARIDRVTVESIQRSAKLWLAFVMTAAVTP